MDQKILITGAAGLIGRELFKTLQSQNLNVIGIDNWTRFPAYENEDILNTDVSQFVKSNINDFDIIYHFAAINGTASFYERPLDVLTNNIVSDFDVFKFAEQNKKCKLIYASSSEVIAGTGNFPTKEEIDISIQNINNPRWSYRLAKITSENYLYNSKIDFVNIRFFNLFSEHSGRGHFVFDIIDKIKANNFNLIGAEETRSFCYVKDAVPAIIKVCATLSRDTVNIGSNEEIKIIDAANLICKKIGVIPNWSLQNSVEGSSKRRCPDLSKLKSVYPEYQPRSFSEVIQCLDI